MAFHELIRAFTREFLHRLPHVGNESEVPVFVVGMPRSGKSLVEQILASHDSVFGAEIRKGDMVLRLQLNDFTQVANNTGKVPADMTDTG